MKVDFRTTRADYLGFFKHSALHRRIGWRILIVAGTSLWIGVPTGRDRPFHVGVYLLHVLLTGSVIVLAAFIYYFVAFLRLKSRLKAKGFTERNYKMTLTPDGYSVLDSEREDFKFWRWAHVRRAGSGGGYLFILMVQDAAYLIPRDSFASPEEADNFMRFIRNAVDIARGDGGVVLKAKAKRLRWWGLAGIVPNVGVIAGLILLFRGIFQYKDRWLVIIGVADVLFTVAFWAVFLRWQVQSEGYKNLWASVSQDQLNNLFRDVEFYKIQHGVYPDSLGQVKEMDKNIWIHDPLQNGRPEGGSGNYYYEKVRDKYWLFSAGPDQKPFTWDDIFPEVNLADTAKFGLLLRR